MTEGGGTSRTPAGEDHSNGGESNGGESNGGEMLTKLHSAVSLARPFSTSTLLVKASSSIPSGWFEWMREWGDI